MKLNKVLSSIVEKLSRRIPSPAKPRVRSSKSFRKLKVGQLLQLKTDQAVYGPKLTSVKPGDLFRVEYVDSGGATLYPCTPIGELREGFAALRWTIPEWEETFTRFKKVRKAKK